jgi:hypothetical protein
MYRRCLGCRPQLFVPFQPDNRIDDLCSKVVSATSDEELAVAIAELRRELRQHIDTLRNIATPQVPLLYIDKDDNDAT